MSGRVLVGTIGHISRDKMALTAAMLLMSTPSIEVEIIPITIGRRDEPPPLIDPAIRGPLNPMLSRRGPPRKGKKGKERRW